ncbi:MAG: hypothetical protein SGILL_001082 [Bacillariaceae sp.]
MDLSPVPLPQDPEEQEGVELLLDLSSIVSNEIAHNTQIFHEERPHLDEYLSSINRSTATGSPPSFLVNQDGPYSWGRARTVSFDSPKSGGAGVSVVTPVGSKRTARKASLKLLAHKGRSEKIKLPSFPHLPRQQQQLQQQQAAESVHEHRLRAIEVSAKKAIPITTIYRKKFSWKNYPGKLEFLEKQSRRFILPEAHFFSFVSTSTELEAFLIANREEYLRHSALNYTVQQKQYNNRLTERLLDLAAEHAYVFDEDEFSFVTVRDRVRCYYKSYVQSSKKRGIVLGYAARKAGILSTAELQKSARKEGTIITPPEI